MGAALLAATTMNADPSGIIVPLTRDVKNTPTNGGNQRSPILVPVLYLDGHTLTAAIRSITSPFQQYTYKPKAIKERE